MKLYICMPFVLTGMIFGQTITPIADIQYVVDPATNDVSPLLDQVVTISGVVTAEPWGTYKNRTMFVQDADTAWSGIMIYTVDLTILATADVGVDRTVIAEGDSVTLTGTVDEYYGLTELVDVTEVIIHGRAANPPVPIEVSSLDANAEKYEGVLVKVVDAAVSNPDMGYGEWSVTDGSGDLVVGDVWSFYYYPTAGAGLASITGVMTYSYEVYKLLPRLARDVVEAGPYTRIQRIQQVLGSDLVLLPNGLVPDASYFVGDTVSCIGIVTVPISEMSSWDTTGGILSGYSRFIWQDSHGGPYSSLLTFSMDPTVFPDLNEGDSIIVTGYIEEYYSAGADAGITELWITEPIQLVGVNASIPERPLITTGDLRAPITAEQWELCTVRIEDATVIDNSLPYGEFTIDDGSGRIIVDGDLTNSMYGEDVYGNPTGEGPFVRPENNSYISSIEGFVYHAYGSFSDSTTYRLIPVYPSDVDLSGGPPRITGISVAGPLYGPEDAVTISAIITDSSAVASAVITYRVNAGAWIDVAMTAGASDVWTGTIPATGIEGALVEYYLTATDDGLDDQDAPMSTFFPLDPSQKLLGYFTRAGGTSIADVQYSGFPSGDSYYDGAPVTVTGTVTTRDGAAGSDFVIQSQAEKGYGILCNDLSGYAPTQGDNVTVTGTVDENWEEWSYKYGNNTVIRDIQEVVVNSTGNSIAPVEVTCADLASDPEGYEGTLISIGEAAVVSINPYDWTVNDGTGEILVDQDWCDYAADSIMDTWAVDDLVAGIAGIWNYSYGTFKAQVRDPADLGFIEPPPDYPDLDIALGHAFGNPGDTVTIDVSIANPENAGIHAIEIEIAFDTTVVTWLTINTAPPALLSQSGWMYEAGDQLGALMVAAAGDTALIGSGELFTCDFALRETVLYDTILPVSLASSFINDGTGFDKSHQDGFIQVFIADGDVDSSGAVHAIDASLILQHLSQKVELSSWQLLKADVSDNDSISALDAALILQHIVGHIDLFPSQHGPPAPMATGDLALQSHVYKQGNEIAIPINLISGADVLSGRFTMEYDTLAMEFAGVRTTEATGGFLTEFLETDEEVTIFLAGATAIENNHTLLEVVFTPLDESDDLSEVVMSKALLNENLVWASSDTAIVDFAVALEAENALPAEYALHQNFPNPFNPVSTICYDLPEASDVSLIVYDIIGREVIRLVESRQNPGYYSTVWNGKTSSGWEVPSGLYFARLVTGSYSKSIKMLLLK